MTCDVEDGVMMVEHSARVVEDGGMKHNGGGARRGLMIAECVDLRYTQTTLGKQHMLGEPRRNSFLVIAAF